MEMQGVGEFNGCAEIEGIDTIITMIGRKNDEPETF